MCLIAAFQSLTNSTQFPANHQRLPDITFIDVDPTCSYLEESPYKPFPTNCRKAFDDNLGKMEPLHIYLCMSTKVFYSLDICDGTDGRTKGNLLQCMQEYGLPGKYAGDTSSKGDVGACV
jgi:hypothetical protein